MLRVEESQWRAWESAHIQRAKALSRGHRERKQRGQPHPVEDFLWDYYFVKPAQLHRWHPGVGVVLENAGGEARAGWRFYARWGDDVVVDTQSLLAQRGSTLTYVRALLENTLSRPGRFGCFGLHEWAMVYRQEPDQVRHSSTPMRMPPQEIDRVVESHSIACTHVDAFRFFTPPARPLNEFQPTRASQVDDEQPGCLHAGMDVYKWAAKLGPVVPGEVVLDAFELARDIREVDMRASPYDVSAFRGADGQPLWPIPIETREGKRAYVDYQRGFTARANALRSRILRILAHPHLAVENPSQRAVGDPGPHREHDRTGRA